MARLELRLLGGFQARLGASPPLSLPAKAQALLAYLALRPGVAHPRDKIAALLWGTTTDEQARNNLRHTVFTLRKALGTAASAFEVDGQTLAVDAKASDVDVPTFERLVAEGTPDALERAVALYEGDLLEGVRVDEPPFEEWLLAERERLREMAVDVLTRLLAQQMQEPATERAIQTALRLVAIEPVQESVHRTLMRLYARQGRRGAALKQYQHCVAIVQRELGVEPERETRQLYQEILQRQSDGSRLSQSAELTAAGGTSREGWGPPPAPEPDTLHDTPLIGRADEVVRLEQALERAVGGHGQVVIVLGDAGIGKSRLLAELAGRVADGDGRVLMGRCYESEQILPFGVWMDVLRGVTETEVFDDLDPLWRSEIARLLPQSGPAPPPAPDGDHRRLFMAVVHLLERCTARERIALMVEDVHWADDMTLRLLAFVARRIHNVPLLLVATARGDEIADALRNVLNELDHEPHVIRLELSALSRIESDALARSLMRTGRDEVALARLTEQMWMLSEGNPFVIVEAVRALDQGTTPDAAGVLPLPERVRQTIAARLDRLSPTGQYLVAVAAAIGRQFDFTLLQRAAGATERETADGVEELVRRRILGGVGERLDFTHDRIRAAAYTRLLPARRKALHAAIVTTFESMGHLFTDRAAEFYGALAHHCFASGDHARGLEYSCRAADQAEKVFAHEEALQHYERARTCAGALGLPDRVGTIDEAIGDVHLRRGRWESAVESYQRALGDGRSGGRVPTLNLKIGRTYAQDGDARGPAFLHVALEGLDPSTQASEVAQAMAMLGRYRHYAGRHAEAVALLERAHVLAEPLDDAVTLTEICRFLAGACQHLMRMDESMTWARRSLALGERRQAPSAAAVGYTYFAQDLYFLGRWDESLEWSDRCLQVGQRIGAEARQAWAWQDRARALHGKSDLAGAAAAAREAVTLSAAGGDRRVGTFARAILACADIDLGADEEALAHVRIALTTADALGDFLLRTMCRHTLAYVHLQREEWHAAAAAVDEWTAIVSGSDHVLIRVVGGGYAAEALLRAGRFDEATEMAQATADIASRAGASHYEAVASRVSGQILAVEERWDEAARALDDAIKTLESTGSRLELGRALFHRGLVREARERGKTAARVDLVHACAIFEKIGAVRDLERARRSM